MRSCLGMTSGWGGCALEESACNQKGFNMHLQYQTTKIVNLIITCALSLSCSNYSHSSGRGPNIAVAPSEATRRANTYSHQDPSSLCSRISEIKVLPLKGEAGEDLTYDAFMAAGESVVPCLIEKVTDSTEMRDPRQEPRYPDITTTVGDIAYFLLVDIAKLDFTQALPPNVQERFKEEGVYAYFKYVQRDEHRKILQDNLHKWYRQKYGKDAGSSEQPSIMK